MIEIPKIKCAPFIEPDIDALMDGIFPQYEITREMLEADGYIVSVTNAGEIAIEIIESMFCEPDAKRIMIVDERPVVCTQELKDFLSIAEIEPAPWQIELMAQIQEATMEKNKGILKNEFYNNEPWRRKQWRHR